MADLCRRHIKIIFQVNNMARRIIIIEDDGQPGIGVTPYEGLLDNGFIDEHPCTHCNNNPQNNPFASGVCCCALPDMWMSRPHRTTPIRYTTTYTTTTFDSTDFKNNTFKTSL